MTPSSPRDPVTQFKFSPDLAMAHSRLIPLRMQLEDYLRALQPSCTIQRSPEVAACSSKRKLVLRHARGSPVLWAAQASGCVQCGSGLSLFENTRVHNAAFSIERVIFHDHVVYGEGVDSFPGLINFEYSKPEAVSFRLHNPDRSIR